MARSALLAALALAGCASTTIGPGGGDGGPDAPAPDAARADAPLPDAGSPDGLSVDVPADAAGPDAGAPDGATGGSLRGLWRVVRYDFTTEGRAQTLTDRDTPVDVGGGRSLPFRINGLLYLDATHLALTFGSLAMGFFYAYTPTEMGDLGYTANGYGVPGLLDEARGEFQITGAPAPTRFTRNADGTVSFVDPDSGARTTYARADSPGPALPALNAAGLAVVAEGFNPAAMRPRVALLWDLRGDARWLESNGAALRFGGGFATFPLALAAPPAEAVTAWMGSQVAVARIVAYDDSNNNLSYDRNADRMLGLSPVAITWRAAAPFAPPGAGHFPLRHVPDGLRYGHARLDYAIGREDVVPYDHAVPVSPGVPITPGGARDLPEVL